MKRLDEEAEPFVCRSYGQYIVHRGTVDIPRDKVGRQAGTLEKSSTHENRGMKQNKSDGVASQIHYIKEDRVSSRTKKADSSFLYRLSKFLGICKEDESNVSGNEFLESTTEVGAIQASEDGNSKEKRQESKDILSSDESPRSLTRSSSLADLSAFTGSLSRRCVSFDGVSECLDDSSLSVSPKRLRGNPERAGRSVDSVQDSQNTSNREFENDLRFLSTCGNKTSTPERPKSVIQKPRRGRMLNFNHASIARDHVGLTSPLRTYREQRVCNNWPPRHFCQSLPNITYDTTKVSGNFNQTEPVACSSMPRNSKEFFDNCQIKNTFPFERGHSLWLKGEHRHCLVDGARYLQTEVNGLQSALRGSLGLDHSSLTGGFPSDSDFKPWCNPNFRNEDEEAVYHLVTKYLENEDCKW